MKIINRTIFFKSEPSFYLKELYGDKPNTVRILKDIELIQLKTEIFRLKKINIINTDNEKSFTRELTDISHVPMYDGYGEMFVFSWKNYQLIKD